MQYHALVNKVQKISVDPIVTFIETYSNTMAESTKMLGNIFVHVILLVPVILFPAIMVDYIMISSQLPTLPLSSADILLTIVLLLAGSFTLIYRTFTKTYGVFTLHYVTDIFLSIVFVLSGVIVYFAPTRETILTATILIYSIGAYESTKTDFSIHLPFKKIINTDIHIKGVKLTVIYGLFIALVYANLMANYVQFTYVYEASFMAMFGGAYLIHSVHDTIYTKVFGHLDINTSQKFWFLPSKIATFSSLMIGVFSTYTTPYVTALFAVPFISYFTFYIWFTAKDDSGLISTYKRKQESRTNKIKTANKNYGTSPKENIDLSYDLDKQDEYLSVDLDLNVEIPRNAYTTDKQWIISMVVIAKIKGIIRALDSVEQDDAFEKYLTEVGEYYVTDIASDNVTLDDFPEEIKQEIYDRNIETSTVETETDNNTITNHNNEDDVNRSETEASFDDMEEIIDQGIDNKDVDINYNLFSDDVNGR